jgi:hypothetical protein
MPVQINGFCVINPRGRPMVVQTFSTDELTCLRRFEAKNYTTLLWKDCLKEGYRIGAVSIVVEEKEPIAMEEKLELFKQAVIHAHEAFSKNKKELTDLPRRFWGAWMDLEMACEWKVPFEELKGEFQKSYKIIGAPGDFGYGTPCGDSLKAVYEAWNAVVGENAKTPLTAVQR